MDVHIGRWILKFFLRQSIDNRTLKSLISIIPLSDNDSSLKVLLLLRKIESTIRTCTVPETLLDFLEQIEELNYRDGITVTASMKAAYFAVAFHCTLRFLEEKGVGMREYCNAVNRIWIDRVCRNEGLRSEELDDWKYEMEKGISDESVRKKLMLGNYENDVLEAVSVYVEEEKERLGPSFLELLAEKMKGVFGSTENGLCEETCREIMPLRSDCCSDADFYNTEGLMDGEKCEKINRDNKLIDSSALEPQVMPKDPFPFALYLLAETAVASIEREKPDHESQVAPNSCLNPCADAVQADGSDLDSPCCKYMLTETAVASIEREKSDHESQVAPNSCLDLCADALQADQSDLDSPCCKYMLVETDVAIIERERPDHESQVAPNSCLDLCADAVQANQSDIDSPCCKIQFNGRKPRLMEQNSTSQSHEEEGSVNNLPKKMAGSSLNVNETKKLGRRKKRKWSSIEEDTLRTGVQKFGKGNWKFILGAYCSVFVERTEVDLKDKWRNMTNKLKKLC